MSELATANRILRLIGEKQLTYQELSKMSGVPKSALQRYATGKTLSIPSNRLYAIARALQTTPNYLETGQDKTEDLVSTFSERIQKYMDIHSISQEDLFEKIKPFLSMSCYDLHVSYSDESLTLHEMTFQTFSKYIAGELSPSELLLAVFSKALCVPETWLAGYKSNADFGFPFIAPDEIIMIGNDGKPHRYKMSNTVIEAVRILIQDKAKISDI